MRFIAPTHGGGLFSNGSPNSEDLWENSAQAPGPHVRLRRDKFHMTIMKIRAQSARRDETRLELARDSRVS